MDRKELDRMVQTLAPYLAQSHSDANFEVPTLLREVPTYTSNGTGLINAELVGAELRRRTARDI